VGLYEGWQDTMFLEDLSNAGAMPSLELTMQFAAQRQRVIANNIANIDTPNFVQQDVSPAGFQELLNKAVRNRRMRTGGMTGALEWQPTSAFGKNSRGGFSIKPDSKSGAGGVLFHDRNNRDAVRLMQDLAETQMAFRTAANLYRVHRDIIQSAIAERVF